MKPQPRYRFTVPPTRKLPSYEAPAQGSGSQTVRQNALAEYNAGRKFMGLPPLRRLPRGTTFKREP